MKIVAILCWYREAPQLLAETVAALATIPVDHLVAVDGAYECFPGASPRSDAACAKAIECAAASAGFGVTIEQPADVWRGNAETQKRNFAIRIAEALTGPDDWYLVVDADHVVTWCDASLRARLEATNRTVATYGLVQPGAPAGELTEAQYTAIECHADQWPSAGALSLRMLYRAVRGLSYGPEHWTVRAGKMRLWGPSGLVEAEDLTDFLRMEHRCLTRSDRRLREALAYYHVRDSRAIEGYPSAVARMASIRRRRDYG